MVDKSINLSLESIVKHNAGLDEDKEKNKTEKVDQKLDELRQELATMDPSVAAKLRSEANGLNNLADFAEKVADTMEKGKKELLEKKKLDEVKEVLMEQLGVPGEFVEQLAILVKAGPEALREAAQVYREEAARKMQEADFTVGERQKIDDKIQALNHIKAALNTKEGFKNLNSKEIQTLYALRKLEQDNADLILKRVLELQEEGNAGDISKAF